MFHSLPRYGQTFQTLWYLVDWTLLEYWMKTQWKPVSKRTLVPKKLKQVGSVFRSFSLQTGHCTLDSEPISTTRSITYRDSSLHTHLWYTLLSMLCCGIASLVIHVREFGQLMTPESEISRQSYNKILTITYTLWSSTVCRLFWFWPCSFV